MKRAAVIAALIGLGPACGSSDPRLAPILDVPGGTDADPFGAIDTLQLSIARAGADSSLVERTVAIPEPLTLSEVPFGEGLVLHLTGLSGGAELAYGRSCSFAYDADGPSVEAPHVYFSRVVKWGPAPAPMEMRKRASSFALPDGSAVFAGGVDDSGVALLTAERFDPLASGDFEPVDVELARRTDAVLAPLPDGRAIIIGGVDAGGTAVPTAELFSPLRTPAVEQVDGPRLRDHAATALVDGTVLATGGRTQSQANDPYVVSADAWVFEIGAGDALAAPRQLPLGLATARADHTMTRLGNEVGADVLIVGGRDDTGAPVAETELYRPLREAFEAVPGGQLNVPRWSHQAIRLPGGFILVVGGLAPDGFGGTQPVADLELFDPVQGRFNLAGVLPATAGLTEMSVTRLPDGRVLLAGGLDAGNSPVDTALIARLDPINGQVDISVTNALAVPRAGHNAEVLCDGTVLVTGGADADAERYNPPSAGRR